MIIIRNFIFLILAIIVGFLGIKFSIYGLIVNFTDNSLHELSLIDVNPQNLRTKRYIKITDGTSINSPLTYIDDRGDVDSYVYPILQQNKEDSVLIRKTNLLIESKNKINNWEKVEIKGLLKPYWYKIDDEVIQAFSFRGIEVDKDGYYLELNVKPWKWYWYLLILLVAMLFFYRLIEAIFKGIRSKTIKNDT